MLNKNTSKLLFILLFASTARAEDYKCAADNSLHTPVVEYVSADFPNKKIVFIGLIHQGPALYYQKINEVIAKYKPAHKNEVTVLTEFATCESSTISTSASSQIDIVNLRKLLGLGFNQIKTMNAAELTKILGDNSIDKSVCKLDLDNSSMRPEYLVNRNVESCQISENNSLKCQWKQVVYDVNSYNVKSADLNLSNEQPGLQWLTSTMYLPMSISGASDENDFKSFSDIRFELILKYRNELILKNLNEAIKESDTIVIPWGSSHIDDFENLIKQLNFKIISQKTIKYSSEAEMKNTGNFYGAFLTSLSKATENNNLCEVSPKN